MTKPRQQNSEHPRFIDGGVFTKTISIYTHNPQPDSDAPYTREQITSPDASWAGSLCPLLWPKEKRAGRPGADAILEPIREALRCRGVLRFEAPTCSGQLDDTELPLRFGNQLLGLQIELGRQLLSAIVQGDHAFVSSVANALRDADELCRRGHLRDAWSAYYRSLTISELNSLTDGDARKGFTEWVRRKSLSNREWTKLKREFAIDFPRGKPGPVPKKRVKKISNSSK